MNGTISVKKSFDRFDFITYHLMDGEKISIDKDQLDNEELEIERGIYIYAPVLYDNDKIVAFYRRVGNHEMNRRIEIWQKLDEIAGEALKNVAYQAGEKIDEIDLDIVKETVEYLLDKIEGTYSCRVPRIDFDY